MTNVVEARVLWAVDLLQRMNIQLRHNSLVVLVAWAMAEGGGFGNIAAYNPLNTTQWEPGCTVVNYAGVKAYVSYEVGMQATITTLEYPAYKAIVDGLTSGADPTSVALDIGNSPWGTNGATVQACLADADVAVLTYYPQEDYVLFIKENNGKVYWFIPFGRFSYWRAVPPAVAKSVPAASIIDDPTGAWLALWSHKG